ncbi:MAG: FAD-binding protein [Bdellovibrio sp.]
MSRTLQFKLGLDEELEEKLQWLAPQMSEHRILKQSVDARRRHDAHFVYSVEIAENGEKLPHEDHTPARLKFIRGDRPLVIGTGPGGLFAALRLAERGLPCRILERGSPAETRIGRINRFWRYGHLDPDDNVCFGEGGAGLYSDGKLITRIKSPHIPYVLQKLVEFGAPGMIRYLSNPHVGSDRIRRLLPRLRQRLLDLGCEIHYKTSFHSLWIEAGRVRGVQTSDGRLFQGDQVILATGHSAIDVLQNLHAQGVLLEGKSFALGLRIEHPQMRINQIQYRENAGHPKLGAANYRLADHDKNEDVGVYSFCMCPGGYVLSSGTEPDALVCNGMSNFHRKGAFANAAIVVSIDHAKSFPGNLWGGLELRRQMEVGAFEAVQRAGGSRELPAQRVQDFLLERNSSQDLPSSSPSGVLGVRLDQLLPTYFSEHLEKSLQNFNRLLPGFISPEAVFHGIESRTSCPIRIPRNETTLESLSHPGLFPCGEGAGYAGGITSAACDGVRIAEQVLHTRL